MVTKLAIFLSGTGSNFEAIADACDDGELSAAISVVFSNNPKAKGIEKAQARLIPTEVIAHFKPRKAFEQKIIVQLQSYKIDWVVLCGYMRVLSPTFLAHFAGRVINIHPSVLPAYPGMHAIDNAFEAGDEHVGVTVHHVDQGVDTGPIILQERIKVEPSDTLEALTDKVHLLEHKVYKKAIASLIAAADESI